MAAKPVIGAPTWDDTTITASEAGSGFGAANLLRNGVGDRWESLTVSGIKTIKLDATTPRVWSLLGVLHSNATSTGGFRVRAANTEAELTSNPLSDSDLLGGSVVLTDTPDYLEATDAGWTQADFSFETWIRVDGTGIQPIFKRGVIGSNRPFLFVNASNKFEFTDLPDQNSSATSTTTVAVDTWYHVAVTYDDTAGEAKIYVDGTLEDTATSVSWSSTATKFRLNNLHVAYGNYELMEPRFWNDVRTATEISDNYETPLDGTETGLLGAWDFLTLSGTDYDNKVAAGPDLVRTMGSPTRTYSLKMWGTDDLEAYNWKNGFLHVPLGVTSRWVQVDILDEAQTETTIKVGRLILSEALQTEKWQIRGSTIVGKRDLSEVQVSPLGYEATIQREVKADARIRFESNESYEIDWIDDIYQRQGTTKDVLYVRDPSATTRVEQGVVHGRLDRELRVTHDGWDLYRGSFRIRGL